MEAKSVWMDLNVCGRKYPGSDGGLGVRASHSGEEFGLQSKGRDATLTGASQGLASYSPEPSLVLRCLGTYVCIRS